MDALYCTEKAMRVIPERLSGDYLITVKANSASLLRQLQEATAQVPMADKELVKNHGRIEERRLYVAPLNPSETGWPHTHCALRVERVRLPLRRGEEVGGSSETAYLVASFSVTTHNSKKLLALVRGHWYVENGLHHRRDRSMHEDQVRVGGTRGSGKLMCLLRSFAALLQSRARESADAFHGAFAANPKYALSLLRHRGSLSRWEQRSGAYTPKYPPT
jgi:hypothetical protein